MPIQNLFPTPIYFDRIDAELHHRLKADVYKYIKENDDLFNTNQWKCNTRTNIFCEVERKFYPDYLQDLILHHTSQYLVDGEFTTTKFSVDDCWMTIGTNGCYQEMHDHLGAGQPSNGFSAVLYVDLENDKGGEFVIDSPINTLVKLLPNNTNQELAPQLHIQPKEGLLISFPSWLMHGTLEYTSTEVPRISISWNINIK